PISPPLYTLSLGSEKLGARFFRIRRWMPGGRGLHRLRSRRGGPRGQVSLPRSEAGGGRICAASGKTGAGEAGNPEGESQLRARERGAHRKEVGRASCRA